MLVLLALMKTVHKFSLHVNEGRKGCRDAGMQKAGCPDCQSAMLPILDLGSMIGFVGLEGVVCVPFLVLFF